MSHWLKHWRHNFCEEVNYFVCILVYVVYSDSPNYVCLCVCVVYWQSWKVLHLWVVCCSFLILYLLVWFGHSVRYLILGLHCVFVNASSSIIISIIITKCIIIIIIIITRNDKFILVQAKSIKAIQDNVPWPNPSNSESCMTKCYMWVIWNETSTASLPRNSRSYLLIYSFKWESAFDAYLFWCMTCIRSVHSIVFECSGSVLHLSRLADYCKVAEVHVIYFTHNCMFVIV